MLLGFPDPGARADMALTRPTIFDAAPEHLVKYFERHQLSFSPLGGLPQLDPDALSLPSAVRAADRKNMARTGYVDSHFWPAR